MRENEILFPYMTASAYQVVSREVENHFFRYNWFFRDIYINNPHWPISGSIIFIQIWCSYFRYTGRLFLGWVFFVDRYNIIRVSWETKQEWRLSYRKRYIECLIVRSITLLIAHSPFYVIFCYFLCLLSPPSQLTYLLNDFYKDACYWWYSAKISCNLILAGWLL